MSEHPPEFLDVSGTAIAVRRRLGASPGVIWLGGYRSDMAGTKARALDDWAAERGRACLRHDYSGHGESGGDFHDGTISRWLAQSLAVFETYTDGPQILVGSSMGAWIALLMAKRLAKLGKPGRVAGLVLLAPAPDFTTDLVEPKLTQAQRDDLAGKGFFETPSQYGPDAYVYTRALLDDGRENRVLTGPIDTFCPVHILQGLEDPDVPYAHALKLVALLPADDVTLALIPGGDHRLSRPQDIAMMIGAIDAISARVEG